MAAAAATDPTTVPLAQRVRQLQQRPHRLNKHHPAARQTSRTLQQPQKGGKGKGRNSSAQRSMQQQRRQPQHRQRSAGKPLATSSTALSAAPSEAGLEPGTLTFASRAAPHPSGPHYARHTVPAAAVRTDAANAPASCDRPPSYEAGRRSLAGWAAKVKAAAANVAAPTHAPLPPQQLPAAAHAQQEHGNDGGESAIEGNSNFQTTENDSPPPPVSY